MERGFARRKNRKTPRKRVDRDAALKDMQRMEGESEREEWRGKSELE